MRRVVVQVCATLAWIAIIIPGAYSQIIDFSGSAGNDAPGYRNSPELSAMNASYSGSDPVIGAHGAFSGSTGRERMEQSPSGLRESFLQPEGAALFAGNSGRGMYTTYSIDTHTFCITATDARYVSAYPSRSETACLLIDDLAVPAQGKAAPVSQPVMMFLGGIGLMGLSGAKMLKKKNPNTSAPFIVQGKNATPSRPQMWKQFESKAA